MKVMKKILTMLFVMMMVLGMGTAVYAADDGEINITGAKPEQTYKIYRILDLESYDTATGNYAYKANSKWKTFLESTEIKGVYVEFNGEYVTWKTGADAKTFAELALKYANDYTITADGDKTTSATDTTVNFTGLQLGYYLVDSSVGALCSLNTTNKIASIAEKNDIPTIDKKITDSTGANPVEYSTASIGDAVYFKTTIVVKTGAQNYILHDKMGNGLTFDSSSVVVKLKNGTGENVLTQGTGNDYLLSDSTTAGDGCAFHIEFLKCDNLKENDEITITYSATLNENAEIGTTGNKNETWLKYGDGKTTTHKETLTKTFEIPVFKYHVVKDTAGTTTDTGLAGVTFTLSKEDGTPVKLEKITAVLTTKDSYRVTTGTSITLETNASGQFDIKGLAAGKYKLTEVSAPAGFNKLAKPIEIEIANDGTYKVDGVSTTGDIKIENKTGTILPSTGGVGTTMMYIVGAVLLIGSGVVLITKKKVK